MAVRVVTEVSVARVLAVTCSAPQAVVLLNHFVQLAGSPPWPVQHVHDL